MDKKKLISIFHNLLPIHEKQKSKINLHKCLLAHEKKISIKIS
jgi:hypothetical protein